MVSTITENFYQKFIKPRGTTLHENCVIDLKAANGLSIPYIGYVELDVKCAGKLLKQRGFLIVKDPTDDSTRKRKEAVPGIIAMNIIGMCKDIFTCSDLSEYGFLSEMFKGIDARERKSIHGFARYKGTAPIHIPARTVVVIPCTGPQVDGDVLIEPLSDGSHLHRHFQLVRTYATVNKGRLIVRAANIGDEDFYIKPRTRKGTVSKCEIEHLESDIDFNRVGTVEEIFIKQKCDISEVTTSDNVNFKLPEDIYKLDCTADEKAMITNCFRKAQ